MKPWKVQETLEVGVVEVAPQSLYQLQAAACSAAVGSVSLGAPIAWEECHADPGDLGTVVDRSAEDQKVHILLGLFLEPVGHS